MKDLCWLLSRIFLSVKPTSKAIVPVPTVFSASAAPGSSSCLVSFITHSLPVSDTAEPAQPLNTLWRSALPTDCQSFFIFRQIMRSIYYSFICIACVSAGWKHKTHRQQRRSFSTVGPAGQCEDPVWSFLQCKSASSELRNLWIFILKATSFVNT